jgi:tetratricopeptide (TPR) repeat protein
MSSKNQCEIMFFSDSSRVLWSAMRHLPTIALVTVFAVMSPAYADPSINLLTAVKTISTDAPENKVLNQLQAGVIAFDLGHQDEAGFLFDEALSGINTVYANDERAAAARSLWRDEGSKDFKGEPYERAMAHYYRGLLDMLNGDYENARASFKSGLLQDAFAEDEQHRTDFALLIFLEAWCSQLLGSTSLADDAFAELSLLRPDFVRPPLDHDLLVIAETGKAPRKIQDGIGGNILVYRTGKRFQEVGAQMVVGGDTIRLLPMESVYWQASTRGGRPIDGILDGQIRFKNNTQAAASTISGMASGASLYAPLFGESSGAFAAIAGVAGIATLITSQVKARADSRYWNNLPDMIHIYTMKRPENVNSVDVQFLDANGEILPQFSKIIQIQADEKGRSIAWARSRSALDVDTK